MRVALVAVALVAAVSVAAPGDAAAKKKPACWKALLTDWYDGRIDKTYPLACYREALKHLPTDVEIYSSARDDIQRALQTAIQHHQTQVPPGAGNTSRNGTGTRTDTTATTPTSRGDDGGPSASGGAPGRHNGGGPVGGFLGGFSDSADSVPVPLLILAGLAVLLIAAGVAGIVVRHLQTRQTRPAP